MSKILAPPLRTFYFNTEEWHVKKFYVALLCLTLLCGVAESGDFPGFTVTETGTVDIIGAETVLYTHDKTGGRVMHIMNEDTERALLITFETPALDNKGIPHVLEHVTLAGSQNYPSHNLFFAASSQTFNTHMNASVTNSMTSFQFSTMSEPQLLLMTDYFLDTVFFPLLYTDEMTFLREGWRFELECADSPLEVNGTVFNEMKGARTIQRAAWFNMLNTLFPGTPAANDFGGVPEYILTMTYEDCVNFHRTYYHPSNALIFLYGDLDIGPFLELIGSYFDKFDRADIHVEKGTARPLSEPVTAMFEHPVEMSSRPENNSVIQYAFSIGKLSPLDYASFEILASILAAEASPVVRRLREALPAARTSVSFSTTTVGSFLAVSAAGVNEGDGDTLKAAVDEAIAEITEVGFDQEFLEAVIASQEFYVMSMSESSGLGFGVTFRIALLNSFGLGLDTWNNWQNAVEIAKANYRYGYFEALVGKHIAGNPHNVLVTTIPAPGLREKLDEQFRAELDVIRAGMPDEEIAQIIEMNRALAAMAEKEVPVELLERLTAVTVETLPLEVKTYNIREMSIGGVRAYVAEAAVGGLNLTNVAYNSAAVTLEDLHFLNLYAALMGQVRTENLGLATLQTRMTRLLYRFGVTAGSWEYYDYSFRPVFSVQWYSINDSYAEAAALVQEMLANTDVTDVDTISGVIGRLRTATRQSINNSPHSIMRSRAIAGRFDRIAYNDYTRGVVYHQFLSKAQELLENDPEGFTARLRAVRDKLRFKDGVIVLFAGNADGIEIFEKNAHFLFSHLIDEPVPAADLSYIPRPADREGVVIEASVQHNVAFASLGELGLEHSGKFLPLTAILTNAYLAPMVRDVGGAYGVWALADRYGLAFISYRDPSVAETFAVFEGMADFAAGHELTQEDIDRFIIRSFSRQTVPEGELIGALSAMQRKYLGFPDDFRLNILKEIKSAAVRDLTDFSKTLALAMEKGTRSTAGGQAVILENAGLFESIVYPFACPRGTGGLPQGEGNVP